MLKGPIALGAIRTSFVLGLRLLIQAGTLLLVARMLGPEQFGVFAGLAALALLLGTFSTFGTHFVLLGEMAKDKAKREKVLGYAVPTTIISGSLLLFLYLLLCLLLFNNIALSLQVLVCIGLAEIILLPLILLPAMECLAQEKTARSQLLIIMPLGLRALAAAMLLAIAPEAPLSMFSWLYLAAAILAVGLIKLYKSDAWLRHSQWSLANKQQLKNSAGYAALVFTAAGPAELDKLLAVKLLPLEISGLYVGASRVVGAATLPVTALLLSALPKLFRYGAESTGRVKKLNRWILGSVFLYGVALAGVLWLAAPVVQWLFGSSYQGVEQILQWLCLAVPGLALRISTANLIMTMGQPWLRAGSQVFGMAVLVVAAYFLYPEMGALGMPLAFACSEWSMALAGVFILKCNSKCVQ